MYESKIMLLKDSFFLITSQCHVIFKWYLINPIQKYISKLLPNAHEAFRVMFRCFFDLMTSFMNDISNLASIDAAPSCGHSWSQLLRTRNCRTTEKDKASSWGGRCPIQIGGRREGDAWRRSHQTMETRRTKTTIPWAPLRCADSHQLFTPVKKVVDEKGNKAKREELSCLLHVKISRLSSSFSLDHCHSPIVLCHEWVAKKVIGSQI